VIIIALMKSICTLIRLVALNATIPYPSEKKLTESFSVTTSAVVSNTYISTRHAHWNAQCLFISELKLE